MSATLAPLNQFPSAPGTREWRSFNPTNFDAYVFVITQSRNSAGVWSGYTAVYSVYRLWVQTLIYGARPTIPTPVAGSPFAIYADMLAACQGTLNGLP